LKHQQIWTGLYAITSYKKITWITTIVSNLKFHNYSTAKQKMFTPFPTSHKMLTDLLPNGRLINEIKHITATSMVTCNEMSLFETVQL
jgi:hypothetical protein